jgi:hypothetical protein
MTFYLGTHIPSWLWTVPVPLFISAVRLRTLQTHGMTAKAEWALDSGGFSEIGKHGGWTVTPKRYAAEVTGWRRVGKMRWAAIQDWMCEPVMLAKTGLSVLQHQNRTVRSMLDLQDIAPDIPWAPVLQGWVLQDYLRHIDAYCRAGIDLTQQPVVGVGSVCRRQHTSEAEEIVRTISGMGIRVHAFGFKVLGLRRVSCALHSADSLAWSFTARMNPAASRELGCTHANCANCVKYALRWRERLLSTYN